MYNEHIDYKKISAKELLESINLKYYEKELDNINTRKYNVSTGRKEFAGIYNHAGLVYTGKDAERRLKELDALEKKIEKKVSKYRVLISTINSTLYHLDDIARDRELVRLFEQAVENILISPYDYQKQAKIDTETEKKFGRKIFKLIGKDRQKESKKSRKIMKPAYRALKKFASKISLKRGELGVIGLDDAIERESRFSVDGIFDSAFSEMCSEYHKKPYYLGIKQDLVEHAVAIMKNKDGVHISSIYAGSSEKRIEDLQALMKLSLGSRLYHQCRELLDIYQQSFKLAREVEALNCVINAFKDTDMKDLKSYEYVVEVCREQERNLQNMLNKADEKYKSSNIEVLVEIDEKLSRLYRDYQYAKGDLARAEEKNLPYLETLRYREKVSEIRGEMISILNQYPELNRYEYSNALGLFEEKEIAAKKKGEELKKPSVIKGLFGGTRKPEEVKVESVPVNNVPQPPKVSETPKVEVKPINVVPNPIPLTDAELERIDDEKLREEIVTPAELSDLNIYYYQEYMKAKFANPELKQLKYWEYLQQVRPSLKNLIELEKKKEERLENIYKKYLKYRMGLEDKKNYMSFREFVKLRYNVVTIPPEFEERHGISR